MKKYLNISSLALLLAITLMAGKCSKETTPLISDQLPPATQTGANTFGCLVNGKVFIPNGYNGRTPNPSKVFDIGLNGLPYLGMKGQKINMDNVYVGEIIVSIRNIKGLGNYNYPADFFFSVSWDNWINNCPINTYDTSFRQGGG